MNGVGLEFNHLFGFGVLDAGAMVALSKEWKTVPARYHCDGGSIKESRYTRATNCFQVNVVCLLEFLNLFCKNMSETFSVFSLPTGESQVEGHLY